MKEKKDRSKAGDYFDFREVVGYFFRSKDAGRPASFSLRAMHGINKISIIMFLFGIIFLISKHIF